ncbi:hypothetical protein [Bradyrhizobium sp. CB1015]|uniref:hypothetical protein n=1 Tax=Bradyrhizobium sp. CB1015 TaxID=2976822 RepID=UPI0021AAEF6A|nr:hypothetical protein [Bradyrhizobium sp. CB1015]UWU93668.1 hypothetical protein N2604_07225 [Bradyrhizobium sp. CB1015]
MGPLFVVQQDSRTPTKPFFARFFIDFIPGLVAEFAFMERSGRLMMSLSAALWMDRKRIDGWRFQHGRSIGQHALTPSFWQLSRLSASMHLRRSLRFSIWR